MKRMSMSAIRDQSLIERLETLSMNDARSSIGVFCLGYPHLLEGGQGGENRATCPNRDLALGWLDDPTSRDKQELGNIHHFLLPRFQSAFLLIPGMPLIGILISFLKFCNS